MTSLLQITDLSVALPTKAGPQRAVDGVNLSVDAGEILGIAGESGSGKTMTAMAVLGLLPHGAVSTGSIRLDGTELIGAPARRLRAIRGKRVALVSQDPATSLHPILPIRTQITEHMRYHLGISKSEARSRGISLLADVRIPDPEQAMDSYPGQFSGGMRQRIAIAVALACEPDLLLADEPTTALDVTVQAGILRLLDRLRSERGLAVMIITHDLGVMSAIADRVMVMYAGRVVEGGSRKQLLSAPRHPYTRGLLDALPHPGADTTALRPIQGTPPSLGVIPAGCAFHPRCPFAEASCTQNVPVLATVQPGHVLACPIDPLEPTDD
jgi:oligopeptide/dipeptide ABC transporter ATP-binding protein